MSKLPERLLYSQATRHMQTADVYEGVRLACQATLLESLYVLLSVEARHCSAKLNSVGYMQLH